MRNYDYTKKWEELLTPQIVGYLTTIHEYKGEQRLIASRHADVLHDLVEVARIQSTESSNKIEGIYTSDERLRKIVLDKTMPRSRNEREIAGYRDVLNTIYQSELLLYCSFTEIYINLRMEEWEAHLKALTT